MHRGFVSFPAHLTYNFTSSWLQTLTDLSPRQLNQNAIEIGQKHQAPRLPSFFINYVPKNSNSAFATSTTPLQIQESDLQSVQLESIHLTSQHIIPQWCEPRRWETNFYLQLSWWLRFWCVSQAYRVSSARVIMRRGEFSSTKLSRPMLLVASKSTLISDRCRKLFLWAQPRAWLLREGQTHLWTTKSWHHLTYYRSKPSKSYGASIWRARRSFLPPVAMKCHESLQSYFTLHWRESLFFWCTL